MATLRIPNSLGSGFAAPISYPFRCLTL